MKPVFANPSQEFVYLRTYARWRDDLNRREVWPETVDRVIQFLKDERGDKVPDKVFRKIKKHMLELSVLPSMRLVWAAGDAAKFDNTTLYNCSFIAVDSVESFSECVYILMCGTGVGFSVEKEYVEKLPTVPVFDRSIQKITRHVIADSKAGWADAVKLLMSSLYNGEDVDFDYSLIRPQGAKLKTMGGRASGPAPLINLIAFVRDVFQQSQGRKLKPIECHDIMNKIAEIVVAGGVRRCLPETALISTPKGLIQIKDLSVGQKVYTKNGAKSITNVWNNGRKELTRINTVIGPVYSTPEHKWAVLKDLDGNVEWKETQHLTTSDSLVILPRLIDGVATSLPDYTYNKPKHATTTKNITIPPLDPGIAWFFGQLHGDGYVYYNTNRQAVDSSSYISVACSNALPDQHTRVVEQFSKFNMQASNRFGTTEACSKPRVVSQQLAEYLSQFKKPNESINIPSFITCGLADIRAAYIAGVLDADGCISKTKDRDCGRLQVAGTVYENFAIQLRSVLLSLGIASKIVKKLRKKANWQTMYYVELFRQQDITTFGNIVGPFSSKWKLKSHLLDVSGRVKDQHSFSVDPKMLKESQYNDFDSAYYSTIRLGWRKFEQVAGPKDFIPLRIKSLECNQKTETTFDIEVDGDHHFIADGILSHNSSEISLSDLDDEEMQKAKAFPCPVHRFMANNSAVYKTKPDTITFMKEWTNLAASGSGERGIFNLESIRNRAPKRRQVNEIIGTNPCQPAWAPVLTPSGIKKLGDIQIGDTIWSGANWTQVVNKWSTGVKDVYEYTTPAGTFYGTENHKVISHGKRIEAGKAHDIDAAVGPFQNVTELDPQDIMDGLVFGDGSVHKASNNLIILHIGAKDGDYFDSEVRHLIKRHRPGVSPTAHEIHTTLSHEEVCHTYNRVIPDRFFYATPERKSAFLRGLFTANGCVTANRVQYKTASKQAAQQIQTMLSSLGHRSSLVTNKPAKIKHHNGEFTSKASYNIILYNSSEEFMQTIGFLQKYKQSKPVKNSNPRSVASEVKSRQFVSTEEVFDITVSDKDHTYWTGGLLVSNCGEISLRSLEFCNLSTVIVKPDDTLDDLLDKVETATWIGSLQSSFIHFPYLRKEWQENCREEALLGVSLSGQMDNTSVLTEQALRELREKCIKVNKHAAKQLGINQAKAITCGKPEGSTSQLTFSGSGCHPWYSPYYIRRIRISSTDPLFHLMRDQGVPCQPEVGQTTENATTWVIDFPSKAPDGAICRDQVSSMDQLEWYKKVQTNWCEHNQSITVYVKPEEWIKVGNWVYENWDIVCGLSFLPYDGGHYELAPYEEITKDKYEELLKNFPVMDFSILHLYENHDQTEGAKSYACVSGACEIV